MVPRAEIIAIDQGPDLCAAAKQFLGASSLRHNHAKAYSIVFEADFFDNVRLEGINERRQNGPDILVCISYMRLFTSTNQTKVASMWTRLLVPARHSGVIFTAKDHTANYSAPSNSTKHSYGIGSMIVVALDFIALVMSILVLRRQRQRHALQSISEQRVELLNSPTNYRRRSFMLETYD